MSATSMTFEHDGNFYSASFEMLTPELAAELLRANDHNRRLDPRNLRKLLGALQRGEWQFNGDAIRVAVDGSLLDGQHRCELAVRSGATLPVLVVRGLAPESQLTMDENRIRRLSDALDIRGERNTKTLAALIRALMVGEVHGIETALSRGSLQSEAVSKSAAMGWLNANPWVTDLAHSVAPITRGTPLTIGTAGLLVMAMRDVDREDAEFFWARVLDGVNLAEDSPIYALRGVYKREQESAQANRDQRFFAAVTIKAWNFYRDGEVIQQLRFRRGGAAPESFPTAH